LPRIGLSLLRGKHFLNQRFKAQIAAQRIEKWKVESQSSVEGGSFIYLVRIAGHQIFIMGSMNYIERESLNISHPLSIIRP